MSKLEGLIGIIDARAGLQIEAALTAFDGLQYPQWIRTMNAEEFMFEWWSVESYLDETNKKFLLFTYHKLDRELKMYYDFTPTEEL